MGGGSTGVGGIGVDWITRTTRGALALEPLPELLHYLAEAICRFFDAVGEGPAALAKLASD